jgi:uncharacterized protein (DUF1684 family)
MDRLLEFRREKDRFFGQDPESPLTEEQKKQFKGLTYFPENPELKLEAQLQEFPDKDDVAMQTTTGKVQVYQRYGKIEFLMEGRKAELTVYKQQGRYFLPFVDSLRGVETYPAGRYLEPLPLKNGALLVDFNYSYNPYCAYNERWSCPVTPAENRIPVPIRAGEKLFHMEEA